jgi:Arc/MetJ-type ribon-helix-helix transcriptional regulator
MTTINISLPIQLKAQADDLVKCGLYASFSDLVRSTLRREIKESKYDIWAREAEKEMKAGKTRIMETDKDIEEYIKSIAKRVD